MDTTLHQIDTELKLGSGLEQCSFLWSEVEKVLVPMLKQEAEAPWSKELQLLAAEQTAAFNTAETAQVRTAFYRLQPRAKWFFYQADKELKDLSNELDQVGDKLRDILCEI